MENKIEISKESKEILKKCWVINTDHTLDEENLKLKNAITEVLKKTMTSRERSEWGYQYFIEHKQYKDGLEYNKKLLKVWAEVLKGSGNANYDYAYAIERLLKELDDAYWRGYATRDTEAQNICRTCKYKKIKTEDK